MKTSLALYAYIYKPLEEHLEDDKFEVIYYSLEMAPELLFAKLLSLHIFYTYGVEISTKELLSRKKNYTLPEEYLQLVIESMDWLKKVESKVTVYDKGLNAESLYASLAKELSKRGEFKEMEKRKIYVPNNPDKIILVVIDHLSLVKASNGRKLKEEMDLISSYLVTLRNMCGISPLVLMQANRESSSMERRKENMSNLTVNDTKDSGSPK